jgi:hypothetical protein
MNRRIFLTSFFAVSLNSCKDFAVSKSLADKEIVQFHDRFNQQKFNELYLLSHAEMKTASTEADFIMFLKQVFEKLGKCIRSTEDVWRVNSKNLSTTIVLTQKSEFEFGKGVETFTFAVSAESCLLKGFYINSPNLKGK